MLSAACGMASTAAVSEAVPDVEDVTAEVGVSVADDLSEAVGVPTGTLAGRCSG